MIAELAIKTTNVLKRVYSRRIKLLSKWTGLHSLFIALHDGIWQLLIQIGYILSDETVDVSVGNAEATFHTSSRSEYERATTLIGEREIIRSLLSDGAEPDTFWDIGANVGLYTCLVSDILSDDSVVAFEPHPGNAERLQRNLRLNGQNAVLDRRALSNTEDMGELHIISNDSGAGAHSLRGDPKESQETVGVTLTCGDTLVADGEYNVPNLVKIDVEGAEFDVLEGMKGILNRPECRVVYVEVHRSLGVQVDDIQEFLVTAGFEVERLHQRGSTTFLKAKTTDPIE